jgi:hypothetical protein
VTRTRLRPAHTAEQLAELYAAPHEHRQFPDHRLRVAVTAQVGKWLLEQSGGRSAADLSCGDGMILRSLGASVLQFGDLAAGYQYTGPIENTIHRIDPVDLFVCCETIEHLDEPGAVLAAIRAKAGNLLLSTPVNAWDDYNPEHYWAWSRGDVEEMAAEAGFRPVLFTAVDFRPQDLPYCFGIWGMQ